MKLFIRLGVAFAFFSFALSTSMAQQPQQNPLLAQTPPMGWNSWNHFGKKVTEADVRAAADALVSSGMRDAGYIYVNIDGSWEGERDANGVLHVNPEKFKDMQALGDYIHSKGLKFGIYSGPGPVTCGGFTASYGHEQQDATMFASWGADFLKYDLCSFSKVMKQEAPNDLEKQNQMMKQAYEKMHRALLATGRPMVYSISANQHGKPWEWGAQVGGNLWRTSADIKDSYDEMALRGFSQAGLAAYAGPGHWNDPDMLEVGNGGMTADEYRTQMSLWSILAAPLIAGNDLTKMTAETKSILMNKEIIAVDQDPLGRQGDRAYATGPLEVWIRPLEGGAMAVGLFNRLRHPHFMTLRLADIGWNGQAVARNLWSHQDIGVVKQNYTVIVPADGVEMLRLSKPGR